MEWDASIDRVAAHLAPGIRVPGDAVDRVRAAVESLPGACWVSVEWHDDIPAVRWLRVFWSGNSLEPDGPDWDALRRRIASTIEEVLA